VKTKIVVVVAVSAALVAAVVLVTGGGDEAPVAAITTEGSVTTERGEAAETSQPDITATSTPDEATLAPAVWATDIDEVYDPYRAGEPAPPGFRQLLPRDGIPPIYAPSFVDEIDWADDTLVIGLEIDGDARAYPVGFLNRREMVIDSVAGIPVLVTW
jgi:hypothetical protein